MSRVPPAGTPRLMAAALRLAERGWYVFPLRPRDKRPLRYFTRWQDRATRDPRLIERWWLPAPHNIGVATGPSNLLVVDCDIGRGDDPPPQWAGARHGLDVLARLARSQGAELPLTLRVRTPSGGCHLYFAVPDHLHLPSTAGTLGWHVDTRGVGGYVVGPGSVLAQGWYRVTEHLPVAPLPTWLREQLITPPVHTPASRAHSFNDGSYGSPAAAILASVSGRVAAAAPGARNNELNRAAFILGRLVGRGELSQEDVVRALGEAARVHVGLHGFTQVEMERMIANGLHAGKAHGR